LPFSATVSAEVDSLIYEFTQSALQQVLQEDPAILRAFARNLAELGWKGSQSGADAIEPDATKIENLVHQYEGQIKANYTVA
jgi:hypothetical protein